MTKYKTTTVRLPENLHKRFQGVVKKQYNKLHGVQKKEIENGIRFWIDNKEGNLMIVEDENGERFIESVDNITLLNLSTTEGIEPVRRIFNRKQLGAIVELLRKFATMNDYKLRITKIVELEEDKVSHDYEEVDPEDIKKIGELMNNYWKNRNLLPYKHIVAAVNIGKKRVELTLHYLVSVPTSFL